VVVAVLVLYRELDRGGTATRDVVCEPHVPLVLGWHGETTVAA